jgi:hypothetical protein
MHERFILVETQLPTISAGDANDADPPEPAWRVTALNVAGICAFEALEEGGALYVAGIGTLYVRETFDELLALINEVTGSSASNLIGIER